MARLQYAVIVVQKVIAKDALIADGGDNCIPFEGLSTDHDFNRDNTVNVNEFLACSFQFCGFARGLELRALFSGYLAEKCRRNDSHRRSSVD